MQNHPRPANPPVRGGRWILLLIPLIVFGTFALSVFLFSEPGAVFAADPALLDVRSGKGIPRASVPVTIMRDQVAVPLLGPLLKWFDRWRGRPELSFDFSPSAPQSYPLRELLAVSARTHPREKRYFLAKEIAAGNLIFGTTNSLNGPGWSAALEQALQKSIVSCVDDHTHVTNQVSVTILDQGPRVSLIVPTVLVTNFTTKYPNVKVRP